MDLESQNEKENQSQNFLGQEENFSPFRPPNEEQVFITREAEK
jgi:hypothetical protein